MRRLCAAMAARLTLRELMLERFAMQAGNLVGVGFVRAVLPEGGPGDRAVPGHHAVLDARRRGRRDCVDMETGRINVTKLVNVADVGRAINPSIVERQLIGAAIMQAGFTLFEEMILSDGQVLNASLADYKIPGFLDLPRGSVGGLR